METKQKHKSGFALLKEKLAKAEAELAQAESARNNYSAQLDRSRTDVHNLNIEVKELKEKLTDVINEKDSFANDCKRLYKDAEAKQTTIEQQSRKISQLTADLKVAQGNLETKEHEYEHKLKEMFDHMGWFKRMTWNWCHVPTFKEDEIWNETH